MRMPYWGFLSVFLGCGSRPWLPGAQGTVALKWEGFVLGVFFFLTWNTGEEVVPWTCRWHQEKPRALWLWCRCASCEASSPVVSISVLHSVDVQEPFLWIPPCSWALWFCCRKKTFSYWKSTEVFYAWSAQFTSSGLKSVSHEKPKLLQKCQFGRCLCFS